MAERVGASPWRIKGGLLRRTRKGRQVRKMFFSEEKNQKTFIPPQLYFSGMPVT
jgi:hypothetical protein